MTLIMTSDRCPECGQIIYLVAWPKKKNNLEHIVINVHDTPHGIADGVYLDRDGCLVVARFDENTDTPDYTCIHCGWFA